ncbi:Hypothetical protein NCS54_01376100 [Fusarium falciforme]|uniref:Hypothetical protein n=1 Tax=Fusarium falciforme TaxID=195108 RepID=UPI00230161B6|nr:Hypothetical protein NCS54_01376100 [Fusarium falciforme]WAO96099.1 Hypothetical protein NCS54_01376100 [Fusarium falciforme]
MPPVFHRPPGPGGPSTQKAKAGVTLPTSKDNTAASKSHMLAPSKTSNSFSPRTRTLGEGVPGFRTSFDVSGKGGGAFKPISENFSVSPANGTMSFALPICTSPSRGGYEPKLSLAYDSGAGNGLFGFGWSVSLPLIHRKTTHAVPRYNDDEDDLAMSGADIIRRLNDDGTAETRTESGPEGEFDVAIYRPRFDNGSVRIERWARKASPTDVHWRTLTADNETAIYGDNDHSRIMDTSNGTTRIFSWMLSRSYDAFGNAIEYTYKQENAKCIVDADGIMPDWEMNRTQDARCRQKYIKRIKYGNRVPNRDLATWEASKWPQDWMFELVFDYGEHSGASPSTVESHDWPVRRDAFSQSQAGFEVRTYRLCQRLLMFHHFPKQTKEPENLVFSVSIQYDESPQRTVLRGLSMSGHALDKDGPEDITRYRSESLPPWSFEYTPTPESSHLAALEANVFNLLELPDPKSKVSEWLDLDGEGIPGLLIRSNNGTLCYQRNKGPGSSTDEPQFCPPIVLGQQPSLVGGTFQDLDRNGHLNYVLRDSKGCLQGFFERGESDTWSTYSNFPETPSGDTWPDSVAIDLTGDGLVDTLCVADDSQALVWQQNLGKKGLSGYKRIHQVNPSSLPRLTQTPDAQIHVADMTGSGLSDVVQVSATSVRYWPNLGYGNFGAAVDMGNPPLLSTGGEFDHARVRLIDVDGSGTTDLLYVLPTGGAGLYYNLSGNSWSEQVFIQNLPLIANPSLVFTLDILGKGTGCLCWADTSDGTNRIKYLDLMGDTKPHLLQSYSNGLGAVTSIAYTPSTKFFLDDESRGLPWSTKLPFPVQCVAKVELNDTITGNQHSTEYIYHNGCYDQVEKQFAGFEMVEEFHREKLIIGQDETCEPPVTHTKSWFSVGLGLQVDESRFLTRPLVSSNLQDSSDSDPAEHLQALRGVNLRSETYSQDGTDKASLPFVVQELSYQIKLLQSQGPNKYSAVQVNPRETLSRQYERNMQDPRTTHDIILKTNLFGDVEESLHIVYPRACVETTFTDVDKNQKAGNMSHTQIWYTEDVQERYNFRKPAAWRQREYEILNFSFNGTLTVEEARKYDFQVLPTAKCLATWKALRSENRAFYKDSLLEKRLDEGKLQAHSLLDQTYTLAFTPDIMAQVELGLRSCSIGGSVKDLLAQGKYVSFNDSEAWWAPSSRSLFYRPESVGSGEELKHARESFYTPSFFVDVFENVSRIRLDENFLLTEEMEDALGSITLFKNDYENLQPVEITDPNLNTVQVVLDPLGQILAVAALGKGSRDEEEADSVQDMVRDVSLEDAERILLNPAGELARRVLGNAGSRSIHCINRYSHWKARQVVQTSSEVLKINQTSTAPAPAFTVHMTRALPAGKSRIPEIRVNVSYMNGLGGPYQEVHLNDLDTFEKTWLIPGHSVSDKAGHAICTYHPCFTTSPAPLPVQLMKANSVIAFHDAMGRSVASLAADCTWTKTVFNPWATVEYNAGDLILKSRPQDDPDVGHFFTRIRASRYSRTWYDKHRLGTLQEKRAAEKSSIYSDTPVVTHIGSCGLPIRTVRVVDGEMYTRSSAYDVDGNKVRDVDSYDRLVEKMVYDKLGRMLQSKGMDKGESWALHDAQGQEFLAWNCRGYSFMTRYDGMRREIEKLVQKGTVASKLVTRITYGESCADAPVLNLKEQVWKVEDQAGVHMSTRYDVRGRCLEKTFQSTQEYKRVVDWRSNNLLEKAIYSHTSKYDSFGQVLEEKDAQGNRTRRHFTRQGHVDSVEFSSSKENSWKPYLSNAIFSADGLPLSITYGNTVTTQFVYDENSRELLSQQTVRGYRGRRELLEDITHIYDCLGRLIFTYDKSEQVKYFKESRIKPEWDYTYDQMGNLISATGRGQLSSALGKGNQLSPHSAMNGLSPTRGISDGNLLYQYLETYKYDREGNMLSTKHDAPASKGVTGWTRSYFYEEQSLLSDDPLVKSNRLSRTAISGKDEGRYAYSADAGLAGCMTSLPKFSELDWNMDNMLSFSSTQYVNSGTPERTYYVYGHTGKRVRKVTESAAKADGEPRKKKETLFLSGVEFQARSDGSDLWIASVGGDSALAMVEVSSSRQRPLIRFQTGNNMELDDQAQLVSYEEYSPFGSVTYSAVHGNVEAPRIYRFAKYEHDRETGLYHCGHRYYCPWVSRWTSPDPLGDVDGPNLYEYVKNDPVNSYDPSGTSKFKKKLALHAAKKKEASEAVDNNANALSPLDQENAGLDNIKSKATDILLKRIQKTKEFWTGIATKFENKMNLALDRLRAAHQKMMQKVRKPPGDQHHLFRDCFEHFFTAAGIDHNKATLFCDKEVHDRIGPIHDRGWEEYFISKLHEAFPHTKDLPQRLFRQALRDEMYDFSQALIETIEADPAKYREEMMGQLVENMLESGMNLTLVTASIAPYQVPYEYRGERLTWEKYMGFQSTYSAPQQMADNIV